jgi:hypothetical protein
MSFNKKFFTTGGIVASTPSAPAPAGLDPLQNFETVTYTGNGGTQKITGYIRKGAAFNGSSSYITTSLDFDSLTDYSISMWIYISAAPSPSDIFAGTIQDSGALNGFYLSVQTDRTIRFFERNGSTNVSSLTSTDTINVGSWNHLLAVRNGGTNLLYINNGTAVSTSNGTITHAEGFTIGRGGAHTSSLFNGKIDQVRIFNKALDSGEVDDLYLETYADPKKSTTDYFDDGSGVALYELDEDANSSNFGQAASFNGSSSQIAASESIISTPSSPYSFSLWFKKDSTNYKGIFMNKSTTERIGEIGGMFINATTIGIYTINTSNSNQSDIVYATVPTMSAGVWYHLVIIADNSLANNGKVYINGTEASSYSFIISNANMGGATGNTLIGTGDGAFFDGDIDQVRIYDAALSTSDITKLYEESSQIPTANLVAHYKLDGNAEDVLDTYDGTASNVTYSAGVYGGTPTNVNFLGMAFQPDLVWVKRRDSGVGNTAHLIFDSVRGAGERLSSHNANQESTFTDEVTSFDSNGFTVGADASTNGSGGSIVAWCWRAGGNSNTFNVDGIGYSSASAAGLATGTNNPTGASVNTKSGFSIIKLNSGSVANSDRTVAHGLGVKPSFVLFRRTSLSAWFTWSAGLSPESYYLYLQESYGVNDLTQSSNAWGNQSFTDTTISWRNSWTFSPNEELIAYVWADIPGYQKSGSYTGNDSSKRIYTDSNADGTGTGGFAPRFLLIKCSSNGGTNKEWNIFDTTRDPSPINKRLEANTSDSEFTDTSNITINSDGFTLGDNGTATGSINQVGFDYIYLAIA